MAKITFRSTEKEIDKEFREKIKFSEANRGILEKKFDSKAYIQFAGEFDKAMATKLVNKMRRFGYRVRLYRDSAGYWVFAGVEGSLRLVGKG